MLLKLECIIDWACLCSFHARVYSFSFINKLISLFRYFPKSLYSCLISEGSRVASTYNALMSFLLVKFSLNKLLCLTENTSFSPRVLQQNKAITGWQHHNLSEICSASLRCDANLSIYNLECIELTGMSTLISLLSLECVANMELVKRILLEANKAI